MFKLFFLIGHFIKKRIFTKTFLITNIIFFIAAFLILIIPSKILKPSLDNNINTKVEITLYYDKSINSDQAKRISDLFLKELNLKVNNQIKIKDVLLLEDINLHDYPEIAKHAKSQIAIFYRLSEDNFNVYYYTNFYNNALDLKLKEIIKQTNHSLKNSKDIIVNQNNTFLDVGLKTAIKKRKIFPFFIGIYMGIIMALVINTFQISGNDVMNEKNARMVEQIMMNVSSGKHFYSKVIGALIFSIAQLILGLFYMFIAFAITTKGTELPSIPEAISTYSLLAPIIVVIIFTFIATIMAGLIGTTLAGLSNSYEEYSQISVPFMFTISIFFYLGIFLAQSPKFPLTYRILSYLPVISLFTAPGAYIFGNLNSLGITISILSNVLFIELFSLLVFPQYKDSLLSYESNVKLFKRLFVNIKEKRSKK